MNSFRFKLLALALVIATVVLTSCTTPTPTPTPTPGGSPKATTTISPTPSIASPTPSASPSPSVSPTASPSRSPSPSPSVSPSPSASPTASPSPTPSRSPSPSPSVSPTPIVTPTASPTPSASPSPSPSASPAASPSPSPTYAPVGGTVEVLGVWGADEQASFMAMMQPWIQQTGAKVNFTGTRDLTAVLTSRIQAGNPPDVAILPNPGLMQQLAKAGNLKPLTFMNMNTLNQQYAKAWIDLGSYNNQLYSIFMKAANKSLVWYNPKTFTANAWQIPKTWDDMITLSNKILSDKKTPAAPWSVGVESGAASGWPATDWIAQIFLNEYGGNVYDQWVAHQIPWTDSRIKEAWQRFGSIVSTNGYVPGGAAAVLATNFQDASFLPFQSPPKAAMYYEGDFVEGFIKAQFPSLVPGQDFSFFVFPTITAQYGNGITGGADEAVIFRDNPTIESFMNYISSPQAQEVWVKRGGFTSVNKAVPISDYPDVVAQQAAQLLANATLFRFGAGDSMPSAVQTIWWANVLKYLQDPTKLDSLLQEIENQAKTAYGQ